MIFLYKCDYIAELKNGARRILKFTLYSTSNLHQQRSDLEPVDRSQILRAGGEGDYDIRQSEEGNIITGL